MTRKKFIDFKRILLIIIILLMSFLMAFTNNQTLNTETQQIETIINLQNKKIDTINKIIKDTRPDIN
jgi:cell division protein FtsL